MKLRILGYISLITILITICAIIFRGVTQPIGFTYILESLSNFNNINIPNYIQSFTITADWGILEFLRNFLNIFTTSFGAILNFCGYLLNALYYMYQFMQFLFVK